MKEKRESLKKRQQTNKETKRHAYILIARDVFVALAVQARMIKCGKESDKLDKLFALQKIAKLQGIGFKIYRYLTKSATFQFRFMWCSYLNQRSFFLGGGVGVQWFGELCVTLKKWIVWFWSLAQFVMNFERYSHALYFWKLSENIYAFYYTTKPVSVSVFTVYSVIRTVKWESF